MTTPRSLAAGALLLVLGLSACSGGASSESTADSNGLTGRDAGAGSSVGSAPASGGDPASVPGTPQKGFAADGSTGSSASGGGDGSRTAARVLPNDRDVVYTGSITVRVTDVARATSQAESAATGAGGLVFSEQTSTDPKHPRRGRATLSLRVPPAVFGETLDQLAGLGKELDRQRSAEDVTTQVADVASRVRSQQRSVDRVRVLLGQAKTIGEVVQVESELARREADLESLQAQQAALKNVTDLASINLTLVSPDRVVPPKPEPKDNLGFLAGLRGGWNAFVGILAVTATVLGALVPFLVTALLLGVPALLVWRSRRRQRSAPAPVTPAA